MATKKLVSKKNLTALAKLEAELRQVEDPQPPPIPAEHLIAEGRALAKVASKHEKELKRVGVDAKLLGSLLVRTEALAEAQTNLTLMRKKRRSTKEIELEKKGIDLRSEMIADGRFALRDDVDAQAALDRIQEGEGLDDLVQDLRDLGAFAKENKHALAKVGAKADLKSELALRIAQDLGDTLAARRTGDGDERLALDLRDRAATHLVFAIREIRAAGAYAFRKEPEIGARFRGAYDAKRRRASKAKAKAKQPEPVIEAN